MIAFFHSNSQQQQKMIPLKTNRRVLLWMCVYQSDELISRKDRWAHYSFAVFMLVVNFLTVVFSLAFFVENVTTNFEESLFALMQIFGPGRMLYILIIILMLRERITHIFKTISTIHETYADLDERNLLMRPHNNSELMWSCYFILFMGPMAFINVSVTIFALIFTWPCNDDFSSIYHTFRFVLPFNQSTLTGYIGEIFYTIICGECYLFAGSIILFFISCCQYHRAFYDIFEYSLRKMDNPTVKGYDNNEHIRQLVDFHVTIRDLFHQSADTFSPYILVQLLSASAMLSIDVFHLDLQIQHIQPSIITVLLAISDAMLILFLYCYFGKIASESSLGIADLLFQANWQALPVKLQKYLIVMITNAQQPLYYHGFGVAVLNLETYTKLIGKVITYYMMFKAVATAD